LSQVEVVYEDDDLLVVNKPSGLLTHPSFDARGAEDLHSLLQKTFGQLFLVHRLDRGTSGLIIMTKRAELISAFQKYQEAGTIKKSYLAIGKGQPDWTTHSCKRPLTDIDKKVNRECHTDFEVLKSSKGFTLFKVVLHTGRRHQIRRHLAHLGHHIVGDTIYGKGRINQWARTLVGSHLMLHATELAFTHPTTQRPLELKASPPLEFNRFGSEVGLL
jgi:tRNA pseudouridine65 synthase